MSKKLLQIDLDGVLNNYNGSYQDCIIPDIKNGAYDFIEKLAKYYEIELFTVREKALCKKWLIENNLDKLIKTISNTKNNKCTAIIDDRAINFNGSYNETYEKILKFQPYWKKSI